MSLYPSPTLYPSPLLYPGVAPTPASTLPVWAPTVDEVAVVTPAYTRGGFDDDRVDAGGERGTYDETTEPTRGEVEQLIAFYVGEIEGKVPNPVDAMRYGLAKATVLAGVKSQIASDKQPAGTADAGGEYRGAIARYLSNLDRLVAALMPVGGRLR